MFENRDSKTTEACSDIDLDRFVDGECSDVEAAAVRRHLAGCPVCAREYDELCALGNLLRNDRDRTAAPERLREAVLRRLEADKRESAARPARSRGMGRRGFATAALGAMAAGAALAFVAPRLIHESAGGDRFVSTFTNDFATFLSAGRALDRAERDAGRLAAWYGDRLDFVLPSLPTVAGANHLVGGRLCWLFSRRLAALSFEGADGPFAVYVMQAEGLDLPSGRHEPDLGQDFSVHRTGRLTNLVWRHGGLAVSLVGESGPARLKVIASALANAMTG